MADALIVDASVALAWALPDEISPYADAALNALTNRTLRVPDIWPSEVANGLAVAYLRGRITHAEEQLFLAAMSRLTIQIPWMDALTIIRERTAAAVLVRLAISAVSKTPRICATAL